MAAQTLGGHDIGDVISARLDRGETYMVRGNGRTKGIYDLTGTKITSEKPFGLISFHMRTMIPSECVTGRGFFCEMLPQITGRFYWSR